MVCQSIRTRCEAIDRLLVGGVRCGTLTEVVGESGSGKTQLCLQLSLTVQLPPQMGGLYGVVVFYYCDYTFPTRRLQQIRDAIQVNLSLGNDIISLDNVLLCKVEGCRDLCQRLEVLEKECAERIESARHVRLVVIDSIASLCRSQFMNTRDGMSERKMYFNAITSRLRKCATKFNFAVVITNQVIDVVEGTTSNDVSPYVFTSIYGHRIQPSLGSGWSRLLDNRIVVPISEDQEYLYGEATQGGARRRMKVVFSPYLECNECTFTITSNGVV